MTLAIRSQTPYVIGNVIETVKSTELSADGQRFYNTS